MKKKINDWNTDDVLRWIRREVGQNVLDEDLVRAHELDGRDLIDLTEENLKYDLNIINLHHRKVFLRKLCELLRQICANVNDLNVSAHDYSQTEQCTMTPKKKNLNRFYPDITETAMKINKKNNFVSFEALDNWEKNGYSLTARNNPNPPNKSIIDDRVTINSFYNISNLNNFSTAKKVAPDSLSPNQIGSKRKFLIGLSNKSPTPQDEAIQDIKRMIIDKKVQDGNGKIQYMQENLLNYNSNAQKIKKQLKKIKTTTNTSDMIPAQQNSSRQESMRYSNNGCLGLYNNESEIEDYLKSVKKSSTFMLPSETRKQDSKLKTYIIESKKNKPLVKNNLRQLLHMNITSSVSKDDQNVDSSISN